MKPFIVLTAALVLPLAAAAPGAWKGTITMYVQDYTPNVAGVKRPLKAFQQIADEYTKKYPGIKITFSKTPVPDNDTMVRVKAAAGELFDIYWAQVASLNSTLPKGVAVNLAPTLEQPNPYIPGNKAWKSAVNARVLAESTAPNGAIYALSGDVVAFTPFYNAAQFKKAGIAKAPTSWTELLEASKKLKAAGLGVMTAVPAYPWWSRHFQSDLYSNDYARISGFDGQPGISALDEAVAIQKGILSPKDERFMSWWPVFKQFTDYWDKDYLTLAPEKNYDAFQTFVGGKEALLYEGSYKTREMQDAGIQFPVGAFNFPKLSKKESKYATGVNTANVTGGTGSFQFAVSSTVSNKSMSEPGKLEAVLDWMKFFGTPKNVQRIVGEGGTYVPTWPGTTPKFDKQYDSAALSAQIGLPYRSIGVGDSAPNLGWGDMQRIFGLYLSGNLTYEAAKAQVQQTLDRAAADYARKNKVDFSKYK